MVNTIKLSTALLASFTVAEAKTSLSSFGKDLLLAGLSHQEEYLDL